MIRYALLAPFAVLALLVSGCSNAMPDQRSAQPIPPTQAEAPGSAEPVETVAEASTPAEAAGSTLVPPIRGTAEIAYVKPSTKAGDRLLVTTFRIRNASAGAIAGLKLEEFWWDKAGNPLTGSSVRLKKPLKPGEIATLRLETPRVSGMYQCNYRFSHANGTVKAVVAKSLD